MRVRFVPFVGTLILASLVFLSVTQASVQPTDSLVYQAEAEKLFQEGLQQFSAGGYLEAGNTFLRVVKEFPGSHRTTAAYLMAAKSAYRRGAYRESIKLLRTVLDLYPESSYADNIHYTLALNYYQQRRVEEAAAEHLAAFQATKDPTLRARSAAWLEKLASSSLSTGQLQLLLADAHQDEVKALLTVALAERIFRAGDTKTAEELLKPISTQPDHSRFAARAREMLEKIRSGGVLKVGVLLPLLLHAGQRAEKEPGEELLAGVKLATEEHNLIAFPKVSLEVRDSEREPSVAARRTEELCADNEVIAIVGPAHSAEALQSAQIANSRGVPMITPTATASGIAAVGSYIFQANPDHATRGRIMAQYARTQLGAQTAALVVPNDEVGRAQAESFINESERNGLEVVDVQWYEPGATDLRQQFMALRQKALARTDPYVIDFSSKLKSADLTKLLRFGVPQRTLDSLVERGSVVSVSVLLGPAGKRIADSLKIPTQSLRQKVDSLTIPVKTIDVLYLPIADAEEIGVVSSQVRYFNFASTLLGGGEWNDPFELEQHRQYTDGMIFPSDSYWSENDARYRAFAARYENTFGTKPTKNVLYTYDLMKALLTIIANGARQRDEIATALSSLRGFEGIHSNLSFTPKRVNGVLSILQYRRRMITRLGQFDLAAGEFFPSKE